MKGTIHLDTLYLVVKYPYLDIFERYYEFIKGIEHRKLKEGIVAGDFVLRGGASLYKVSLWHHDARLFLTDQVDQKLGDGKGAGIWIQLGPKFLIEHFYHIHSAVKELLFAIGVKANYPIKITRLDVALDLFDVDMKEQNLADWQAGWVGRSKVSKTEFNSRTGALETIYIGSRQSSIYVRIYDKIAQAFKEGDIEYWLDIWKGAQGAVTRFEWEVKPCEGNFGKDLQDFSLFTPMSIIELLNYLLDWGRLCIPNPSDSNNRRWEETPLWKEIKALVAEYSNGVDWPMSRYGKEFKGISEGYINFLTGTIAGGMARFGQDNPNMVTLIEGLAKNGYNLDAIQRKAKVKAAIQKRL